MDDMIFKILDTSDKNIAIWHSLLTKIPDTQKDVHFLPEYGKIYEKTYGHKFQLAVYESREGMVLQPFSIRPLNDLPFLKDQHVTKPYFDTGVSYGYGGPVFASDKPHSIFPKFQKCFHKYCIKEGIASEFTIVHPFLNGVEVLNQRGVELTKRKEVVFVDLSKSEEVLWQELKKNNRNSINKAKRSGVVAEKVDTNEENFAVFEELYFRTMARRGVEDRWLFPKDYFRNCTKYLGEKRTSLFFARVGALVVAADFLMHDFEIAYYHFAGSDENYFKLCPNNLLLWEAILWTKQHGFKTCHLGGGVSSKEDDSLLRFKSTFSPRRKPLYTYDRVHNKVKYQELCALKKEHERLTLGKEIDSGYFPLYRR